MLDLVITQYLGYVIAAITSLAGAFLYHKQEKQSKELDNIHQKIQNESDTNAIWQRIVEERNAEVDRLQALVEAKEQVIEAKDNKIATVYKEKGELRARLEDALRKQADAAYYRGLYENSRCDVFTCPNRKPPFDITKLIRAEESVASAEEVKQ